jgi:hypothetical protein
MIRRLVIFGVLTALPVLAGGAPQNRCLYAGQGLVAGVDVLGLNIDLSSTGPLPSAGGSLSTQLLSATVPGVLNLSLLSANAMGGSNVATANASVTNVSVTAAGVSITAAVLTSNANAQACNVQPAVSGSSTIADLKVNGLSVTVTGEPNQVIPLIVGSLIINEQIGSVSNFFGNTSADMVVNALHLRVLWLADVVISQSHAGVCGSTGTCTP